MPQRGKKARGMMAGDDGESDSSRPVGRGRRKEERNLKKAKIIVRNLPFKNLTEENLKKHFTEYGDIDEVKLLRKADGKFVGCGFVQFKKVSSAAKAIHFGNQKEFNGRKIVLDWALPKDTYLQKVKQFSEQTIKEEKVSDSEDENDKTVDFYIDKKPDRGVGSDSESDGGDLSRVKHEEDEDEGDEDEDDDDDDGGDDDDEEDDDDDEDDSEGDFDQGQRGGKAQPPRPQRPSDAEDGRTLFFRNVPFSATNDDLRNCVTKYGPVEYALICVDKLTEHSKGTGFVRFKTSEDAAACLKDGRNLYIDDAPLTVTYALTKENLDNRKANKKVVKDSRNLYLIREGVVVAGSKAATGVSASDMAKRLQLEQWKTQILKNLNMFVSRTRLVVHNLPPSYDDTKLRKLFLKHGNPKAVIREAKVMWEKNKLTSAGEHVSKEVGFVSFADHDDALLALRNINNNPTIFSAGKRPIVAFSIENRAVINQKQKRVEKSRAKLGVTLDEKMSKLNRKQRRFIRRRQKIIEKRREMKKARDGESGDTGGTVTEPGSTGDKAQKGSGVKRKRVEGQALGQKKRKAANGEADGESEFKAFTGVTSEPGKKVKFRSRFGLKKQASLHQKTMKTEKKLRKMKAKRHLEPTKQPKQKQGKRKLLDDGKLSKLIMKHRRDIESSTTAKKWYDK